MVSICKYDKFARFFFQTFYLYQFLSVFLNASCSYQVFFHPSIQLSTSDAVISMDNIYNLYIYILMQLRFWYRRPATKHAFDQPRTFKSLWEKFNQSWPSAWKSWHVFPFYFWIMVYKLDLPPPAPGCQSPPGLLPFFTLGNFKR